MTRMKPEAAAKALAKHLALPSWRGSVFSWLRNEKYVLVVAADVQWRRGAEIPESYKGYKVEQEDQHIGQAFA